MYTKLKKTKTKHKKSDWSVSIIKTKASPSYDGHVQLLVLTHATESQEASVYTATLLSERQATLNYAAN